VYQVGKETKYLQMMHGQPSIKTEVVGSYTRDVGLPVPSIATTIF